MKMLFRKRIIVTYVLFSIIMIAFLSICMSNANTNIALAEDKNDYEEKIYSKVNIEDSFVEDTIIVVLDKEETFKFKEYTPKDFPIIDCVKVVNLMEHTENRVKAQLKAQKTNDWKELKSCIDNNMLIDLETYRGILKITLRERGKDAVIKAIDSLIA